MLAHGLDCGVPVSVKAHGLHTFRAVKKFEVLTSGLSFQQMGIGVGGISAP